MKKRALEILAQRVDKELLPFVRKPGRYIGGEINQIKKDLKACDITIALCFPDLYEIAMSNSGLAILYDIINNIDGFAAERAFAPWTDAEQILREKQIPLFSLESKASLKTFDIIGFSLSNELCYTNVLNMLDLAGLNIKSALRSETDPLIIAGGGMSNCCEPLADFIDLFIIGEGEEALVELTQLINELKKIGTSKKDILLECAKKFQWAYVPFLYNFEYENSDIKSFNTVSTGLPTQFKNAVVEDLDNAHVPLKPIVPFVQAVHERVCVEIMRGCPGRCLFCQASFCKRPLRYRTVEKIIDIARQCYRATGFDTVSLLSLSTAEYPKLEELTAKLNEYFKDKHVGLSLPSLRVDQQLKLFPKLVASVRKGGLTIAVEASDEKLRTIINKPLKDEDLFDAVLAAYKEGWQKLKLYFMVGLPGETENDIKQIVTLASKLAKLRKNIDNKTAQINLAVSWFVPKPHTPLAWLGQHSKEYFENARQIILNEKKRMNAKYLNIKFHNIESSLLESAIGRGDRRLCAVIEQAWKNGAKFDLWGECFNYHAWQLAFEKFQMNVDSEAQRKFSTCQTLPWEHLGGPDKNYLLSHFNKIFPESSSISTG